MIMGCLLYTSTVAAGLVVNDGKIEYSVMTDEYREALRYINKLYSEGLLDPQTCTQDNTCLLYTSIIDKKLVFLV